MRSVEPTPAARTRTRSWPGPGSVTGRSTTSRTSSAFGPPLRVNITARYVFMESLGLSVFGKACR